MPCASRPTAKAPVLDVPCPPHLQPVCARHVEKHETPCSPAWDGSCRCSDLGVGRLSALHLLRPKMLRDIRKMLLLHTLRPCNLMNDEPGGCDSLEKLDALDARPLDREGLAHVGTGCLQLIEEK